MGEEVWKQIEDFPNYYLSDGGRVINLASGKILTPFSNRNGSGLTYVRMFKDGRQHSTSLDRLMEVYHG